MEYFTKGNPVARRKLNNIIDDIKALKRIVGDGYIEVRHNQTGMTISLNCDKLLERIPKVGGGGGGWQIRRATILSINPTGQFIYVDLWDDTGEPDTEGEGHNIEVTCPVSNNGDIADAIPKLKVDDVILVVIVPVKTQEGTDYEWIGIPPWQKMNICS